MPLTDTKCRNAKGQIKSRKLADGGGLHLLITSDGAKYWRLAYRWHGKQRTLALGVYAQPWRRTELQVTARHLAGRLVPHKAAAEHRLH
jgi:hypothetical protein